MIAFTSFFGGLLFAQEITGDWCGLHHQEGATELMIERRETNKALLAEGMVFQRDMIYVPVKFHLTSKNNGAGRISEVRVLRQLCELNEDYESYGFQFFLKDGTFNYINNTTVYENHAQTINTIMSFQKDNRALNIWITETADYGGGGLGTTLAYYDPFKDWIVIGKNYINDDDATLSHEIGHFFSLDHPFHNFHGGDPYGDEADEVGVPAPTSQGGYQNEKMDGSNCETAGDGLCDTPPDYNNGLSWNGCTFTSNVLDPDGTPINPNENLYMSYFLDCPDALYEFSPMQWDLMLVDYNTPQRNYLRLETTPSLAAVTETPDLIEPTLGETVESYTNVNFVWDPVPNATAYLLEISRVPTLTVNPIRVVVFGTSKVIDELEANRTYYWAVRPFSAYSSCVASSSTESFITGGVTASNEPSYVLDWQVAPNPVRANAAINLMVNTSEPFRGQVALFDLNGRLVQQPRMMEFFTGENQVAIPSGHLPAGIYTLRIQTDVGQLTEKVVVSN